MIERARSRPLRWIAVVVVALAVGLLALKSGPRPETPSPSGSDAADADPAGFREFRLRMTGQYGGHHSPVDTLDLSVSSGGEARVSIVRGAWHGQPDRAAVDREMRLHPDDVRRLGTLLAATHFFDAWDEQRSFSHDGGWRGVWTVELTADGRAGTARIGSWTERFRPVESFLFQLVRHAEIATALEAGDRIDDALGLLVPNPRAEPRLSTHEIVSLLRARLPRSDADSAARILSGLSAAMPEREWWDVVGETLRAADADARSRILSDLPRRMRRGPIDLRTGLAPFLRAEITATLPRYAQLEERARWRFHDHLEFLLSARPPDGAEIAKTVLPALVREGDPYTPSGFLLLGADLVPVIAGALGDARAPMRHTGVVMAYDLAKDASTGKHPDPKAMRSLVETVAPLLEARMRDMEEPVVIRRRVIDALVAMGLREDPQATRRREDATRRVAREQEKAKAGSKRAADLGPPAPRGTMTISGRAVSADIPLPGVEVLAARQDGTSAMPWRQHASTKTAADGTFLLEGLVEGSFTVLVLDESHRRMDYGDLEVPGLAVAAAGSRDVLLRYPGTVLRGRVVQADGKPARGRNLHIKLRDAPTVVTDRMLFDLWTSTDEEGRFALIDVKPGVYDLEIPGSDDAAGLEGIAAGAEEHVVRLGVSAQVSGIVVDDLGRPLSGASVRAIRQGTYDGVDGGCGDDGRFVIPRLTAGRTYRIAASVADAAPCGQPWAVVEDVAAGASGVRIVVDTHPRVSLRVDPGEHRLLGLRVTFSGDGVARTKRGPAVLLRAAPEGTWRVEAHVRFLDSAGGDADTWVDVGTVKTGDEDVVLRVPRVVR